MAVTEDTPADMLTGQMSLGLRLPQGNHVKMSVNRSTPMMDLLVQVTTAQKLSPAAHLLQPYGESGLLQYKPSTPIGALDTWTVHVVPKSQASQNVNGKASKSSTQPFEQTYRIQVHLPRKQLFVTRVSGHTSLGQILKQVCDEKCLDRSKYSFRHPRHLDEALSEDVSIGEFRHNQLCLVSKKALPSPVSSDDIMALQQFYPVRESSSRSLSPDSSTSPQPPQPSRPARKRRPAPKPPVRPVAQKSEANISHSRTSSDSSGYHEASVLSESPDSNNSLPDSLPRRSKLPGREGEISRSLGDLSAAPDALKPAQSTSSLHAGRKKKPAPAPPLHKMSSVAEESRASNKDEEEEQLEPLPEALPESVRTLRCQMSESDLELLTRESRSSLREVESAGDLAGLASPLRRKWPSVDDLSEESELIMADEEIDRIFNNATGESGPKPLPSPPPPSDKNTIWECRLPAPPTFRDEPEDRVALIEELREAVSRKVATAPKSESPRAIWMTDSVLSNFTIGTYQHGALRKTTSELNISSASSPFKEKKADHREGTNTKLEAEKCVSSLQSLKVLRTILPQLSQSHGSVNTVGLNINPPQFQQVQVRQRSDKPTVSVTTWGERPKRQVSIKSDRDYVFGKGQVEPRRRAEPTERKREPEPRERPPAVRKESEMDADVLRVIAHKDSESFVRRAKRELVQEECPRERRGQSVYRELDTGNTRAIKLRQVSRLPVVTGVELKKPQPLVTNRYTSVVGIAPQTCIVSIKPSRFESDPREELLESIRAFGGRSNLKRVSLR